MYTTRAGSINSPQDFFVLVELGLPFAALDQNIHL
jgi:hypothetical protein